MGEGVVAPSQAYVNANGELLPPPPPVDQPGLVPPGGEHAPDVRLPLGARLLKSKAVVGRAGGESGGGSGGGGWLGDGGGGLGDGGGGESEGGDGCGDGDFGLGDGGGSGGCGSGGLGDGGGGDGDGGALGCEGAAGGNGCDGGRPMMLLALSIEPLRSALARVASVKSMVVEA